MSWYEAAAYAKSVGKRLPTYAHWRQAAGGYGGGGGDHFRQQPGRGDSPARVGQFRGLGPFGTYDMAGNVKEWCWNGSGDGKRYILGGAWDEKGYMFTNVDARPAGDRDRNFGFRCVQHPAGQAPPAFVLADANGPSGTSSKEKPLTDREFELVKGLYDYDKKRPLNAKVVREEETTLWVHERVEIDAAYGQERLIVHLFLPEEAGPPHQSIIHWPGAGARQRARTIASPFGEGLSFLVQSGRALVWPIYKGTYERQVGLEGLDPRVVGTLNPTGQRPTVHDRLPPDVQGPRCRRHRLLRGELGGLGGAAGQWRSRTGSRRPFSSTAESGLLRPVRPERDPVNYLPRIKIPTLMLNGRYDSGYPPEGSQKPMLRLFGTDSTRKKHSLSDSSHVAAPSPERIQETVGWFDLYLGPVHSKGSPAVASN